MHRVKVSGLSGQDLCTLSMDYDIGISSVHLVPLLYGDLKNSSNCIHFWSRGVVISRACAGKLRGAKSGQKLWTLGPSGVVYIEFLEFWRVEVPFDSARAVWELLSLFRIGAPRLAPRHLPSPPCALNPQTSFEPCRNLILIGIKLLGNYPSKET